MSASSEAKGNPDSIMSLLKSHGFTDSQISTIITDFPQVLTLDAEKSLAPELKLLLSRRALTSELTEIAWDVVKQLVCEKKVSNFGGSLLISTAKLHGKASKFLFSSMKRSDEAGDVTRSFMCRERLDEQSLKKPGTEPNL